MDISIEDIIDKYNKLQDMAFEKGVSGNPGGKPKGAVNKLSLELRESIQGFLMGNFESVMNDFEKLSPKDRVKLYCDLLQYGLPKLQATTLDMGFDLLTNEQLDDIVNRLVQRHESE